MKRLRLDISGTVQGVGFRPYVYQLAKSLALSGFIKNNAYGVQIEIQGKHCQYFLEALTKNLPPLAFIESIVQKMLDVDENEIDFKIEKSDSGSIRSKIPADTAICTLCLKDLFDPESPFYHYPFVSCTQCGPRYSIVEQLPYDRQHTRQKPFKYCSPCQEAYHDPDNRRYHAEMIACAECGPRLSHTIEEMAIAIRTGKIIALKSLGGYQLICDARRGTVVQQLRQHKKRGNKPFALMVLNSDSALQWVKASETAIHTLKAPARPIVVLNKKNALLPEEIAPNLNNLGIMLPYTACHYLLFHTLLNDPSEQYWLHQKNEVVLVVTSANLSEVPLIKDNDKAYERLNSIADLIVTYDRDISNAIDDSVVQLIEDKPAFIRRARGYVPTAMPLPHDIPCTLALGGYLKNTICITRTNEAFVSQPIGNLNNRDSIAFYHETIQKLLKLLNVKPECIAHDRHPDFYSTHIAAQFKAPTFAIQHHHAHLAACAVEYGLTMPSLGLALDGFGLGEDGQSWGGELFYHHGTHSQHLGSLRPLLQPGGDSVIKQPWRMAASVLHALGKSDWIERKFGQHKQAQAIATLLEKQIHCPATSSAGRLFDAASALLGLCEIADYEAQGAMLLESRVSIPSVDPAGWQIRGTHLNMLPLFNTLLNCDPIEGANLFHGTLAAALSLWVEGIAQSKGLKTVLLAGGCFLNKVLSEQLMQNLSAKNLKPLYPRICPPNDSAISLGQAWIAGNQFKDLVCV